MSFENLFKVGEPNWLTIVTFGKADLHYGIEHMLTSEEAIPHLLSTHDLKYAVKAPEKQRFEIHRRDDNFKLDIINNGEFVCILKCTNDALLVYPNYRSDINGVMQTLVVNADVPNDPDFNLKLFSPSLIRRIDFKFKRHAWVSLFVFRNRLMAFRPNGDFYTNVMTDLCLATAEQSRAQAAIELGALNFGLPQMARSIRTRPHSPRMPPLVQAKARQPQRDNDNQSVRSEARSTATEMTTVSENASRPIISAATGAVQRVPPANKASSSSDNNVEQVVTDPSLATQPPNIGQASGDNDENEARIGIDRQENATPPLESQATMSQETEKEQPQSETKTLSNDEQAVRLGVMEAMEQMKQFQATFANVTALLERLGMPIANEADDVQE